MWERIFRTQLQLFETRDVKSEKHWMFVKKRDRVDLSLKKSLTVRLTELEVAAIPIVQIKTWVYWPWLNQSQLSVKIQTAFTGVSNLAKRKLVQHTLGATILEAIFLSSIMDVSRSLVTENKDSFKSCIQDLNICLLDCHHFICVSNKGSWGHCSYRSVNNKRG